MKIKMTQTVRATDDGFVVELFNEGQEYDCSDYLARYLINGGRAISLEKPMTLDESTQELIEQNRRLRHGKLHS